MKVIFMGTPEFAVPSLEALYKAGYEIPLVITQQDRRRGRGKKLQATEVKAKALELGLDVYQPENVNSDEALEKIRSLEPDFIVVAAYGQIIRGELLELAKYKIINVHASLLPKYRGAAPINFAIVNGEKKTGVTIMEVQKGLDTGDMFLKGEIKIEDEDDASSIHDKLSILGGELIVDAIEGISSGELKGTPQNHEEHTYAPMLTKESGRIDWKDTGKNIRNLIRGFKPWPSAFTDYKGQTIKIHWAEYEVRDDIEGEAGEILEVRDEEILVKVKDGLIKIKELQFPGNKKMKVVDYLRGNDIERGVILK